MPGPKRVRVALTVNGLERELDIDPRSTLLDVVRDVLGLTGAKRGCDRGQCGACTLLVDGRRICGCLALAVAYQNATVTTIEGVTDGDDLHPLQSAFIEHDALQCGFCTPGQICAAIGMLDEVANGWPSAATVDPRSTRIELSAEEIRERMSGNLCRCGAYANIVDAILSATS